MKTLIKYWLQPYMLLAPTLPLRHPCRCSDTLGQSSPRRQIRILENKRPKTRMSKKKAPNIKNTRTYCTLYNLVILSQQTMVPITMVVVVDVIAVVWWFRRGLGGRGSFCRCCRLCCCCRGPLCGCWRSWSSGCCGCWWIRWLRRWYW